MAPVTSVVGIVLFLAFSIHGSAFRRQTKAGCEKLPENDVDTKVKGNYTNTFMHGQKVYYVCVHEHARPKGKPFILCRNGTWTELTLKCIPFSCVVRGTKSSIPKCTRVCAKPVSTNYNVYLDDQRTLFAAGAQVSYTCAVGYSHSGGSRYRTCIAGKWSWSPLEMQCERKSCGTAGEIMNGEFIYSGVELGDTARAVCATGHVLVGKATRNCLDGAWDGRAAVCEAVRCLQPESNAESMGAWRSSYAYRQSIRYRCRKGTLVGQRAIWCTENGTWSTPPPVCKDVTCPFPSVQNSYRSGALIPPFKYRAAVMFGCNRGYALVGSGMVSCSLEGSWTPSLPECRWNGRGK